jgi:hypothetical protein
MIEIIVVIPAVPALQWCYWISGPQPATVIEFCLLAAVKYNEGQPIIRGFMSTPY